jgi:hypothetical protein
MESIQLQIVKDETVHYARAMRIERTQRSYEYMAEHENRNRISLASTTQYRNRAVSRPFLAPYRRIISTNIEISLDII